MRSAEPSGAQGVLCEADGNGLLLTAAAALNAAVAARMAFQVRRLAAAARRTDAAGRAAALDALEETLDGTARLHMAQLLRMTAGCVRAAVPARPAARRPVPETGCRLRGRGQGRLPHGPDPYAGGLAILQADVCSYKDSYLCYSVMKENRMLILIARPGTLRMEVLPEAGGHAARLTGKGALIGRRQDGPETRRTGWVEVTVRHGGSENSFCVTIRPSPEGPPLHTGGRVGIGPEDLPLTG